MVAHASLNQGYWEDVQAQEYFTQSSLVLAAWLQPKQYNIGNGLENGRHRLVGTGVKVLLEATHDNS